MDRSYNFRYAVEEFLHFPATQDGKLSDDHAWSKQAIVNKLLEFRADVILEAKNERGEVSDAMRQEISCIEMKYIDRVECPCAPPSGCVWAKSVNSIPTPIMLSYVSNVQGDDNFTQTTWDRAKYIKHARIASKRSRRHYLLREDGMGETYLYVLLEKPRPGQALQIPMFTLAGVFHNPIAVAQYPSCKGEIKYLCQPLEVPFFTDISLRSKIFTRAWAVIMNARASAPQDNLNNDVHDTAPQRKPLQ